MFEIMARSDMQVDDLYLISHIAEGLRFYRGDYGKTVN